MRRNRKSNIKKERIIMIASSAFVLAALTLTGVYMKEGNVESKDKGYTVDFDAVGNKDGQEQNTPKGNDVPSQSASQTNNAAGVDYAAQVTEDDLDYMPMEAGSNLVEIPGLTGNSPDFIAEDPKLAEAENLSAQENDDAEAEKEEEGSPEAKEEAGEEEKEKPIITKELSFSEDSGLTRPVSGDVILPYSMEASIYFPTLDHYKRNPAVIFSAEEGVSVVACADGKVVEIFEDPELGHGVKLALGNGYEATYGQLTGIEVTLDSYVNSGETIGAVAAPTKYFIAEGSNLYFKLTKDKEPVNPEQMF